MTSVSGSDRLGWEARPHSPGTGRTCGGRRGLQSCPQGLPEATGKNKSLCDQALVCGPGGEGCGDGGLRPRAPTLPLGSAQVRGPAQVGPDSKQPQYCTTHHNVPSSRNASRTPRLSPLIWGYPPLKEAPSKTSWNVPLAQECSLLPGGTSPG